MDRGILAAMDRRALAALAGLAVAALAIRLVAFEALAPVGLLGDENYYVQVADHLARGEGHLYVGAAEGPTRAWRPPLHPWLLSRALDAETPRQAEPSANVALVTRLQRLQIALGAALVVLTALLGRALFDARTGWLAGGIAAVYPALVAHSHYLWTETLFATLVMGALLGFVRLERRPHPGGVVATGLLLGAATLVREAGLVVAGVGALWWVLRAPRTARRAAALRGALLVGIACLCVLPWTLRNQQVLGRFVPVSTVGWFALAEGNTLERPDWLARRGPEQAAFHRGYFSRRDEAERLDFARGHALARIAAEQPAWLGKKLVRNLALLLNPDSVLRTKIRSGAYGDIPPAAARWLLAASIPAWLALAAAATLGLAAARGAPATLSGLLLASAALLHVFANATPRFRVPWLPLLAILAAHALLLGPRLPRHLTRSRALAATSFLLFLLLVALPYYTHQGPR